MAYSYLHAPKRTLRPLESSTNALHMVLITLNVRTAHQAWTKDEVKKMMVDLKEHGEHCTRTDHHKGLQK